jgi:hypothetical protein
VIEGIIFIGILLFGTGLISVIVSTFTRKGLKKSSKTHHADRDEAPKNA